MYIPNLDPYSFTGTAVILGYLLTNDFTTSEQAALGAWFNVVGDILASNSSWSAVLEERSTPPSDDDNDDRQNDLDVLNDRGLLVPCAGGVPRCQLLEQQLGK